MHESTKIFSADNQKKWIIRKERKMKKRILILLTLLALFSACSFVEETELKPQTICPVMGGKIDANVYVDYQGQRIYFCCPSCKEEFLKEPERYMKKLAEDKILLESVQDYQLRCAAF